MSYIVYLILLIAVCVLLKNRYSLNSKKDIRSSEPSDIVKTVYADGDNNYALVIYNHDEHNEEQLIWALNNAKGIEKLNKENIYLLNISTEIISRRVCGGIFHKLYDTDYTILKGKENNDVVSYMIIITEKDNNVVFNTDIAI